LRPDFLITGLGNPGKKYQRTRHNIGFMVCDSISAFFEIPFRFGPGNSKILQWEFAGKNAIVAKPMTFMNLSGEAVAVILAEFGLAPEQMLVISDDLNLPFGSIRMRKSGSSGGHKGIQSIIDHLQTKKMPRLRIGIGGEEPVDDAIAYVLKNFTRKEQQIIQRLIPTVMDCIQFWMLEGIDRTMTKFNKHYDFSIEQNEGG